MRTELKPELNLGEPAMRDQLREGRFTNVLSSSLSQNLDSLCPRVLRPFKERVLASALATRIARGTFWSLAAAVASRMFALAGSIIVARWLGKQTFGELGMIQNTVEMFGILGGFGLGMTSTRYVAQSRISDPAKAGRIIALSSVAAWVTGGIMAMVLIILAPWLAANTLAAPHLSRVLQIGAGMLVLGAVNGAQNGALSGFEAFKQIAYVNLISGALGLVVRVLGVCLFGVTGAVWAMVLSQVITCAVTSRTLKRRASGAGVNIEYRGCLREMPVLWGFSLPSVLSNIVTIPANWVCSAMLVNTAGGYSEMGLFTAANQWYSALLFFPSLLAQATLPVLFERMHARDTRGCRRIVWATVRANSCVVFPLVILGCGSRFLLGLYGDGFSHGWPVMLMVLTTAGIIAIQTPAGHLLAASGKMWTLVWINLGWSITFVSANYIFLAWGARGMALARLIAYVLNAIVAFSFLRIILRSSCDKDSKEARSSINGIYE